MGITNGWRDVERQLGCRECDSPKILHPVILFEKLDSVGADSLHHAHLRDDPGGNLSTFRTATVDPTNSSRFNWMAAPCLFRLVALAGIVKEHFARSWPDNPMAAFRAIRLLRRFGN